MRKDHNQSNSSASVNHHQAKATKTIYPKNKALMNKTSSINHLANLENAIKLDPLQLQNQQISKKFQKISNELGQEDSFKMTSKFSFSKNVLKPFSSSEFQPINAKHLKINFRKCHSSNRMQLSSTNHNSSDLAIDSKPIQASQSESGKFKPSSKMNHQMQFQIQSKIPKHLELKEAQQVQNATPIKIKKELDDLKEPEVLSSTFDHGFENLDALNNIQCSIKQKQPTLKVKKDSKVKQWNSFRFNQCCDQAIHKDDIFDSKSSKSSLQRKRDNSNEVYDSNQRKLQENIKFANFKLTGDKLAERDLVKQFDLKNKRLTSQLAQISFNNSSGSKNCQDSLRAESNMALNPKHGRKRHKNKFKNQKNLLQGGKQNKQYFVMNLDFLEDEQENQQITPRQYSKPLEQPQIDMYRSRSFAQKIDLTSHSSLSEDSDDDQLSINKSINIPEKVNKQESELEFLTADQAQNFDNLFRFNVKTDNEQAKLNVSLQSSELNKIQQLNCENSIEFKSSPLMRPQAFNFASNQRKKEYDSELDKEDITHDEIASNLITKLLNEQKSPTKLKVQENLQKNVNFYDEPESNKMTGGHQQQMFQTEQSQINGQNMIYTNSQYDQYQRPFQFQLNPCFEMPFQQISQPQIQNFMQPQSNIIFNNACSNFDSIQQQICGQNHHNSTLTDLQINNMLNTLVYQQQMQLSSLAPFYNLTTLPPILTDLDTQMRSLPLQMQYTLVTDEKYLHRQYQIMKLLQFQQQNSSQQFYGPIQQQQDFQINYFNRLDPQYSSQFENFNNLSMQNAFTLFPIQSQGYFQMPLSNVSQGNSSSYGQNLTFQNNWNNPPIRQTNSETRFRQQIDSNHSQNNVGVCNFNKHKLAFLQDLKPIGFQLYENQGSYTKTKSAFNVTPSFVKKFQKNDDSEESSKSNELSPLKFVGSPDNSNRVQSIFSEQTYNLNCSPTKGQNGKLKGNRLLQMTTNINQMYDKVQKYKKARQKCLEQIRSNKPQVDYIKTKNERLNEAGHFEQQNQFVNKPYDIIIPDSQQQRQSKLGLQNQELSFGDGNRVNTGHSAFDINGLSGLSKSDNLCLQDDDLFEEKLKFDRKNSKRSTRDQYEKIGLGSGGEYVLKENQYIISPENEKYKIVKYLGQGTFGQVVKCINQNKGTQHAVKIIKNKTEFILQGMVEIKILEKLNNSPERTEFEKQHLIKLEDYFVFRDYLCLVFELLQSSLYETIQETDRGLNLNKVREYTRQILEALVTCKEANLIHCDLKPENILTAKDGLNVKLIDFGSAAFNGHQVYTYIQSRYYRAPEVLMGCQKYPQHNLFTDNYSVQPQPLYDQSIDMWSLGCTAIEMFIKIPIFPGKYDYDQLLKILEFCGMPSQQMIMNSQNRDRFFYYNLQQQRYVFKTFHEFVMTVVPPHMRDKVEQPLNYHQNYDLRLLLESHYLYQLKREKYDQYMKQQREIASDTKNHCFLPFIFEYTYDEKLQIDQFIDFVQQILQVDQSKRLTPLQALSHPFITGVNLPPPYVAHPELHLKRFRQANLLAQNEDNFSIRADFEYRMNCGLDIPLSISDSHRSISAPLPRRFSIWEFFKNIEQKNGTESFRPPIYALPENIFYGNCCETMISEFYQESKIRFQLHQDENNLAEIDQQRKLLENHQFCDVNFDDIEINPVGSLFESKGQAEVDQISNISVLEIKRRKSILQIKEDRFIKQPKVTESEKFIRELLQRDVINNVHEEADRRHQYRIKEEQKQADYNFQLIDDYFLDSHFDRESSKTKDKNIENTNKLPTRTVSSLFQDSNHYTSQNRRGLMFIKKEKERSNSSDTIQKQLAQQAEISLFSKNPIIPEELHGSNDDIQSPISSIRSDQYCQINMNIHDKFQTNSKFKSQVQQSATCEIQKHQKQTKPIINISKFAENSLDQSSLDYVDQDDKLIRKGKQRKKKQKRSKVKTPLKKQEFPAFEVEASLEQSNCHFGSSKAADCTNTRFPSNCDPFSNNFSKKTKSAFAGAECGRSHSGSDFDTQTDTDYGKLEYKKGSEKNGGCLTNFKGSSSLRNNTLSNNNSFENPDYLEQLSGSIKGIANNCGGDNEMSGGIRCLRSKRSKKNKKRRN